MKKNYAKSLLLILMVLFLFACTVSRQQAAKPDSFLPGDALPDAPELSARGPFPIGVRTIDIVNKRQMNILAYGSGGDSLYDRPLRLEIWYPAIIPPGREMITTYADMLGMKNDSTRPLIPFQFFGRALRDAVPYLTSGPFPLIIVSHGYPGSRVLMTYLTENLASKGYVVVAIDHTESTHGDAAGFQSTLLNRSTDILFVLNKMSMAAKPGSDSFLSGLVDADHTGLIGYSMGGYGVLNAAGAGYSEKLLAFFKLLTKGSNAISSLTAADPGYRASRDLRIKAVVAFAPWGMQRGVWDDKGLEGLQQPLFLVAGSLDDVSGYEDGTRAIYTGAVHAQRYLLTYENARHNTAPNPPPAESLVPGRAPGYYYHYAEPAWDQRRINNINQHFVTAFFGKFLKMNGEGKFLDISPKPLPKEWSGFKQRTAVGLELLHAGSIP